MCISGWAASNNSGQAAIAAAILQYSLCTELLCSSLNFMELAMSGAGAVAGLPMSVEGPVTAVGQHAPVGAVYGSTVPATPAPVAATPVAGEHLAPPSGAGLLMSAGTGAPPTEPERMSAGTGGTMMGSPVPLGAVGTTPSVGVFTEPPWRQLASTPGSSAPSGAGRVSHDAMRAFFARVGEPMPGAGPGIGDAGGTLGAPTSTLPWHEPNAGDS